jgi:hypothetical protein
MRHTLYPVERVPNPKLIASVAKAQKKEARHGKEDVQSPEHDLQNQAVHDILRTYS